MYSGPVTIFRAEGWQLDSYGNGAAYTLRHVWADGLEETCDLQGDDAAAFREEFDAAECPLNLFRDYQDVMRSEA